MTLARLFGLRFVGLFFAFATIRTFERPVLSRGTAFSSMAMAGATAAASLDPKWVFVGSLTSRNLAVSPEGPSCRASRRPEAGECE